MEWISEHSFLLLFLGLYTILLVHHAMVGNRMTKNTTDFYVGGRSLGGVVLGISFFATYASTNSFIGFTGQAYSYGIPWLLMGPFAVLFSFIAWKWIAPRLRYFTEKLASVTIPDFIGFRFNSTPARVLSAGIVLFSSFLYMTAVFKGIGNLLETFLDIPYTVAILIVFVIVMAYTAVGGFISVVRTDAIQGIVMLLAAILLFIGAVQAAGGEIGAFLTVPELPEVGSLYEWNVAMPFTVLLGIMMATTMKFIVEPRQLSRFYALRSTSEGRKGLWVSTGLFAFVFTLLLPIGLYAHHFFPTGVTDTDQVVPMMLAAGNIFHPVVSAFLLVSMIAAAMSSLDSVLLVMATTCQRDIALLWQKDVSDEMNMRWTRYYVALFAFVTALIALNPPGGIVALTSFSGSLYAACFLPVLLFGLFSSGGNGKAAIASMISGVLVLLFWNMLPFSEGIHRVFPAMAVSLAAFLLLSHRQFSPPKRAKIFA